MIVQDPETIGDRELEQYKANGVWCRINEDIMEIGHAFLEIQVNDSLCRLFPNALLQPPQVDERAACTNLPIPYHSPPFAELAQSF